MLGMRGLRLEGLFTMVTANFLYLRMHGMLELHLKVIKCNTYSSAIVSAHRPEMSSLSLRKVSNFSKMSKKFSLRQ